MTDPTDLRATAEDVLTRVPRDRAEALSFCLGFLDQTVKCYLRGEHSQANLSWNRELVELVLDLHSEREANRTC